MPTSKHSADKTVRVKSPHSHVGLWLVLITLGFLVGVLFSWTFMTIPFLAVVMMLPFCGLVPIGVLLTAFGIVGVKSAGGCRHLKWLFAFGFSFAMAIGLAIAWSASFRNIDVVTFTAMDVLEVFGAMMVGGLAGGGFFWIVAIIQSSRFRVVIQDGTLCVNCAYPVGKGSGPNCPECGLPIDHSFPRHGLLFRCAEFFHRQNRYVAIVLAIVVISAWSVVVWHHLPFHKAVRRFGAQGDIRFLTGDLPGCSEVLVASVPIDKDPSRGLLIEIGRASTFAPPLVEVRLGGAELLRFGSVRFHVREGKPRLVARFGPSDSARIMRDGVPPKIIDCLLDAAVKENWVPPPPLGVWDPNYDVVVECGSLD